MHGRKSANAQANPNGFVGERRKKSEGKGRKWNLNRGGPFFHPFRASLMLVTRVFPAFRLPFHSEKTRSSFRGAADRATTRPLINRATRTCPPPPPPSLSPPRSSERGDFRILREIRIEKLDLGIG